MKEREEKKGRLTVEHNLLGSEEPVEMHLDFIDDLPQEIVSQEGKITFSLSSHKMVLSFLIGRKQHITSCSPKYAPCFI